MYIFFHCRRNDWTLSRFFFPHRPVANNSPIMLQLHDSFYFRVADRSEHVQYRRPTINVLTTRLILLFNTPANSVRTAIAIDKNKPALSVILIIYWVLIDSYRYLSKRVMRLVVTRDAFKRLSSLCSDKFRFHCRFRFRTIFTKAASLRSWYPWPFPPKIKKGSIPVFCLKKKKNRLRNENV